MRQLMTYTVEEAATKLNVSKVAIYNKIKLDEFKKLVTKKRGKTYLDDTLINLIKDSLKPSINLKAKEKSSDNEDSAAEAIASDVVDAEPQTINFNKEFVDALLKQLDVKDIQIQDLSNRLNQEQDLHKNTQILFKQQQPQDIKLLEEHFEELDTKLEEVKTKMSDRKDKQNKKSWFSNIFKG